MVMRVRGRGFILMGRMGYELASPLKEEEEESSLSTRRDGVVTVVLTSTFDLLRSFDFLS